MALTQISLEESRRLFAAAATIVGPAADSPEQWEANVNRLVATIDRLATAFVAQRETIASATAFTGTILRVEIEKRGEGRKGRIVFCPTSGDASGTGAEEDILTNWLDDANAVAVYDAALELVGQEAVLYKVMEAGEGRKYRCLVGIEAKRGPSAETAPAAGAPAQRQPAGSSTTAPTPAAAPAQTADNKPKAKTAPAPAAETTPAAAPVQETLVGPATAGELLSRAREIGISPQVVRSTMETMFGALAPGSTRSEGELAACWQRLTQPQHAAA